MLVKSILLEDEVNFMAQKRNFSSPKMVTTVMRQYLIMDDAMAPWLLYMVQSGTE